MGPHIVRLSLVVAGGNDGQAAVVTTDGCESLCSRWFVAITRRSFSMSASRLPNAGSRS